MDFFERYLAISPDGGSGATEAVYLAVVVLVAFALARWGYLRRRGQSRHGSKL